MKHLISIMTSPSLRYFTILLVLATLVGCGLGGGLSQDDLKRMSRRRPKNDDENSAQVAENNADTRADDNVVSKDVAEKESPKPQATDEAPPKEDKDLIAEKEEAKSKKAEKKADSVAKEDIPSDTCEKPVEELNPLERSQLSAKNIERIAQAIAAYREDHKGNYPPRAIADRGKAELLSWRVELLPYLGYQELYDAFKKDKPWNHPLNKPLIEKIPAVYQSPERFDTRTNYQVVSGASTIYSKVRAQGEDKIEDGIDHTLLALEVNDSLATIWTRPQEYLLSWDDPKKGLGQLRSNNVFVIWGSGIAGAVPMNVAQKQFRAMYTTDRGDRFSSYAVSKPLDNEFFAAVYPEAQAGNVLSPTDGTEAGSGTRLTATRSLADMYLEAAKASYSLNQPGDALLWNYAANLLQPEGERWDADYRWVPALQRPSPTIHFCIGVKGRSGGASGNRPGSGTRSSSPTRLADRSKLQASIRSSIIEQVDIVGADFLELIEEHATGVAPIAIAVENGSGTRGSGRRTGSDRRTQSDISPLPITYLGGGTRSELTAAATDIAGDVLVLFEVKPGLQNAVKWLTCDLIDLVRGKNILSISRIRWQTNTSTLSDEAAYKRKRWRFKDTLEDSLIFGDWPDKLKPRHAEARVNKLAEYKTLNPLTALSEMAVYRNRGLIDTQTLLQGFQSVIGEQEGEVLMLGSEKKRKRVLRNWLPATDPDELQRVAQLRRRRDDEE